MTCVLGKAGQIGQNPLWQGDCHGIGQSELCSKNIAPHLFYCRILPGLQETPGKTWSKIASSASRHCCVSFLKRQTRSRPASVSTVPVTRSA